MEITDLPSVGPATAEKLKNAGFISVLDIAIAHPSNVAALGGVSPAIARKIVQVAREKLDCKFEDGTTIEENLKGYKITTSSSAFDSILDGGIKSGGITEVFGEFGTGKTQLGHQLAVNALKEFPDGEVLYIDTEGTFTPIRIRQMAKAKGLAEDDILRRVKVAKAYNSNDQIFYAEKAEELFKQGNKIVLVIVDSLMALFRAEYTGRGALADRQQMVNRHMRTLQRMADLYEVPVFVTNQVSADPGNPYVFHPRAIGGYIVSHNSRERIFLRRGQQGSRVAKLVDSNYLPDAEVSYIITENGVEDL